MKLLKFGQGAERLRKQIGEPSKETVEDWKKYQQEGNFPQFEHELFEHFYPLGLDTMMKGVDHLFQDTYTTRQRVERGTTQGATARFVRAGEGKEREPVVPLSTEELDDTLPYDNTAGFGTPMVRPAQRRQRLTPGSTKLSKGAFTSSPDYYDIEVDDNDDVKVIRAWSVDNAVRQIVYDVLMPSYQLVVNEAARHLRDTAYGQWELVKGRSEISVGGLLEKLEKSFANLTLKESGYDLPSHFLKVKMLARRIKRAGGSVGFDASFFRRFVRDLADSTITNAMYAIAISVWEKKYDVTKGVSGEAPFSELETSLLKVWSKYPLSQHTSEEKQVRFEERASVIAEPAVLLAGAEKVQEFGFHRVCRKRHLLPFEDHCRIVCKNCEQRGHKLNSCDKELTESGKKWLLGRREARKKEENARNTSPAGGGSPNTSTTQDAAGVNVTNQVLLTQLQYMTKELENAAQDRENMRATIKAMGSNKNLSIMNRQNERNVIGSSIPQKTISGKSFSEQTSLDASERNQCFWVNTKAGKLKWKESN